MHELATAHLHFDPPYPGLVGGTIVQGWLVAKPGRHYADVRAVVGAEIFPGTYGVPRKDLAEFFRAEHPWLLAGFSITLTLPAGHHRIALQGLDLGGKWEPLDTIERDVTEAEAGQPGQPPEHLDVASAGEALRRLLRRTAGDQAAWTDAADRIVREFPRRRHVRHPHRPFHGHLDQPQIQSLATFGRVPITGWLLHESLPIKRVFATTDLLGVQDLVHGRETPFLSRREFAGDAAARCGYDGFLDVPAQLPSPVSVRVYAELEDGSWHLGSVAGFAVTDHESAKQEFARFSPLTFWRAWRALARAGASRGWSLPAGPAWRKTLRQVWREYAAQAPRGRPPAAAPARRPPPAAAGRPGRIHLFTHNLNHEGAPLFLLEYAGQVRKDLGAELVLTSAREGPLRGAFEALGATVQVVDPSPIFAARDAAAARAAVRALAGQVDLASVRLVVANTLSAFWAVQLARQAGCPALFYIHESTSLAVFFRGQPSPQVLAAAAESFRLAGRVSFLTPATQSYYAGLSDGSNYCLNPGWIDLAAIDRFRADANRTELRARLGLQPNQRLVVNVGTVCERKGQHVFARAVELLWQDAPELAATTVFLIIGGRATPYDRQMQDFLAGLRRPNLRILPETGEVYPYFGAADLFVCSSYEESFPRVVLEAMAFALPIASTGVHGIPEITRPDREALLVPPGDTVALAAAMQRLLVDPAHGQVLARAARARVEQEFARTVVLPRHVALTRELADGPVTSH